MVLIKADGEIIGHAEIYRKGDRLKISKLTVDAQYLDKLPTSLEFLYLKEKPKKKAKKE